MNGGLKSSRAQKSRISDLRDSELGNEDYLEERDIQGEGCR